MLKVTEESKDQGKLGPTLELVNLVSKKLVPCLTWGYGDVKSQIQNQALAIIEFWFIFRGIVACARDASIKFILGG